MTISLEISSVFGKAILETDKLGGDVNITAPTVPNRFKRLDKLEIKSARLNFAKGEVWSFSFRFLPLEETEFSGDSGQFLDAYLLETKLSHGHIAFRGDDWWEYKNFTDITTDSKKFGCKYTMRATEKTSANLSLALAVKNSPSTEVDIDTWLAVDHLLHKNGQIQNA